MIQTSTLTRATSQVILAFPGVFYRANGFGNATRDSYIQLHDATSLPANGAVPKKCWIAQTNFEFNEHVGDGLRCDTGIVLAFSTTQDTLTIESNQGQIQCEYERYDTLAQRPTLSTAGDLVTGVNSLQVWADASGPKRLVDVSGANGEIVFGYLMLFAQDNPTNGSLPIWSSDKVTSLSSITKFFGYEGRIVTSISTAGAYRKGCTFAWSTTPGTLTLGVSGASTIQAHYF